MDKEKLFDLIDNALTDCEIDIEDAINEETITEEIGEREIELLNWYIMKLKDAINDELIGEDV